MMLLHLLLRFVLDVVFACEISKDTHCVCGATSRWRLLPATRTLEACMPDLCHPYPQLAPLVLASLFQQPPMDRLPDVGAAFAGGEATNLNLNFTSDDSHSACSCTLKEMVSRYLTLHCNLTFEYLLIYFAYFRLAIHLHLVILTSIKST